MKKLINKMNGCYLRAQNSVRNFLANERGDTNFISIAIILLVVLVVAIIFIGFGDKIGDAFKTKIQELYTALGI